MKRWDEYLSLLRGSAVVGASRALDRKGKQYTIAEGREMTATACRKRQGPTRGFVCKKYVTTKMKFCKVGLTFGCLCLELRGNI